MEGLIIRKKISKFLGPKPRYHNFLDLRWSPKTSVFTSWSLNPSFSDNGETRAERKIKPRSSSFQARALSVIDFPAAAAYCLVQTHRWVSVHDRDNFAHVPIGLGETVKYRTSRQVPDTWLSLCPGGLPEHGRRLPTRCNNSSLPIETVTDSPISKCPTWVKQPC